MDQISQTITDLAGSPLTLSFDLEAPTASADLQVLFNGTVVADLPGTITGLGFVTQPTINLVATGSDTLAFQGFNSTSGDVIDNVVLNGTPLVTGAPEVNAHSAAPPAALLLGGLLMLADRRRQPAVSHAV